MNSKKASAYGLFAAIVVVLQLIATFIKFGPVNITLALAPIIIGAALYGRRFGAFVGTVLGIVIAVLGAFGLDGGFVLMLAQYHPVIIFLVAILKTTVAGYLAGLIYELVAKKNSLAAVIASGIICPIVNTGIFLLGCLLFFMEPVTALAVEFGFTDVGKYMIFGLVGGNFLVEMAVNIVLAPVIIRIISIIRKSKA